MPFILCAMICCCLPCIISILGVRENMHGVRGATEESINALPTLKYRAKTDGTGGNESKNPGGEEGGCVAAGTEKERAISGEDAVSLSFHYSLWELEIEFLDNSLTESSFCFLI